MEHTWPKELLASADALLPLMNALMEDELSVTSLDEMAALMPAFRAAIAKGKENA